MRKIVKGFCWGFLMGLVGYFAYRVYSNPKPKVTLPNPRYSAPAINTAVVKNVKDFTVLISDESMGAIGRGTGILLDSTHVLTCAHVLPQNGNVEDMWIYPYPGAQVVHATLQFVSSQNDLALLKLVTPVLGHKHATFQANVEIGEPIVVVGNLKGFMLWYTSYGIISGRYGIWILSDAVIRGGNSGGPWVNAKGEVVGMTDVGWNDRDGHEIGVSGAVPSAKLIRFLEQSHKPSLMYFLTGI